MDEIRSFKDLSVWQKAMDLVVCCYEAAARFPKDERFGMVSQVQRSAVSIPANIAEGHGRSRTGDYLHHLSIARGSLMELETHVLLARRLNYLDSAVTSSLLEQTGEVSRMLSGLINRLRKQPKP